MKFTVKTELKTFTFTEHDVIMFNGARYILITQSPRPGYGFGDVNIPIRLAEEWIKNGALVECGKYNNTALPLYKFVKEVQ